ncbi:serine protease inhibitor Kazal-type 5-like isoform X3 [Ammospiza caudacuta]|uniref:serine protease inhibitor Kazal-type 5-like isoform X3 n=1 Tax=Ammospiza caudacuta TaxID=2857398 RepID=UPI0027389C0D|nr:serine protease inhibitor Kazal-type 5-like isoform X3 [Ammospiza caudacuta]
MKIGGASVVLALAFFCFFSDVASQASIKNECRKIWSLLRSGKYSCPITRETFSSPNKKGDLNKCMMCQRLLERDSATQGSGGELDRNVNSLGKDECREFRDLFKRGKLTCTRENDPVRDASGKQHSNKCIMCAEKFKRENEQKLSKNRQGKDKDDCSEFRSQFEAGGRLSCTRENAPVRDASGRQHTNKCLMCAERFKKEAQRGGGTLQRNKLPASERTRQVRWSSEPLQNSERAWSNGVQTASKHQGSAVTKEQVKEVSMSSIRGAAEPPGLPELPSSPSAAQGA